MKTNQIPFTTITRSRQWRWHAFSVLALALALPSLALAQTNGTWITASGTNSWSNTANWSGGTIAGGTNSTANFNTLNLTANVVVNLDGDRTVGTLNVGDTTFGGVRNSYTFAAGTPSTSALNLATTSGTPTINFNLGAATTFQLLYFNVPLTGNQGLSLAQTNGGAGGSGTVQMNAANTFTGNLSIGTGGMTVDIGSAGSSVATLGNGDYSGDISIAGASYIRFWGTADQILRGVISGNRMDIMEGTGTTTLMGTNTLSTVNLIGYATNRAVVLGNANALTNANLVARNNGQLKFASGIGTFNLGSLGNAAAVTNAGNITLNDTNGSAVTLSAGGNNGTTTYSAVLSGLGGLTKVGSGTMTLSGSNSYTGTTTISAGQLTLSASNRLSTNGAITITGGTLNMSNLGQTTSGNVRFQGGTVTNGTITKSGADYDAQAGTVSAALAGSGIGLAKTTAGTLTLSGTNAFTGNIAINAGNLNIGSNGQLGATGSYDGTITLASGGTTRLNWQSDANQTFNGSIISSGTNTDSIFYLINLAPTGTGTLTLAAASPDLTSRLIVGQSGSNNVATLKLAHSNAIQMARLETRSNDKITFAPGIGTFNVGSLASSAVNGPGNIVLNDTSGGAITLSVGHNNTSFTYDSSMSGLGGLTKAGTGTFTLAGANTYSGDTLVDSNSGSLNLATNGSLRFVIGGNGTNNGLKGSGVTVISGQFAFDLANASTNAGHSWTIVAPALSNSYGTNFLVAGFNGAGGLWTNSTNGVDYVFAQSNGMLVVQSTGAPTPYNAWVAYWQGVDPGFTNTAGSADPEGDTFINNLEFAFDGNPTIGSPALLTAVKSGTNAVFRYVARNSGVTYAVDATTNLATGGWTNASVTITNSAETNNINIPADYTRKEFTVPAGSREFFRVRAVITP
jgi:fibronectin-binding autotransporter adhesin